MCQIVPGTQLLLNTFFSFGHAVWHAGSQFPDQGVKPVPPATEAQCLNHWTSWKVPFDVLSLRTFDWWIQEM